MNIPNVLLQEEVPEHVRENQSYQIFTRENRRFRRRYVRALLAFFVLGTCNNVGYSVIMTAAEDMIAMNVLRKDKNLTENNSVTTVRECTTQSTSIVLLVYVASGVFVASVIPFVPLLINFSIFCSIVEYIIGYSMIASASNTLVTAVFGVSLISMAAVMVEATILQYIAYFHGNVFATWSSGTGVAGIIGALSYTLGMGKGYRYTMLGMIAIPILMGFVFWLLLPIPTEDDKQSVAIQKAWNEKELKDPWLVIKKKSHLVPKVLYKYIAPLGGTYLCIYFINQGIYELIKIEDAAVDVKMQYQWLQVAYQVGVFISRSSVNCFYIKHLWIMAIGQIINVILFTTTAIYYYIQNYWILIFMAMEEGLFGGAAYVNTFVKIGREEVEEEKQFMSSMTCFGLNMGILISGFLGILAHNMICNLPPASEM